MDPVNVFIRKGDRIQATWFATKMTALAGVQTKFGAVRRTVTGTVRHVRGDRPVSPTEIRIYVDPDEGYTGPYTNPPGCTCGTPHIELKPDWVKAVLG